MSLTPVPEEVQPRTMDFNDAILQIMKGKKVARVSWGNEDYGVLKDEWLSIVREGKTFVWKVSEGDMVSQDWVVVE